MDITPPLYTGSEGEQLLHSIRFPFKKAVYAVGDTDSIAVTGVLVNGDTFAIDPVEIQWSVIPVSSSFQVDSTGRIRAVSSSSSLVSSGLTLRGRYTLGETTRSVDAQIYITPDRYEVDRFELKSADSARGGYFVTYFALFGIVQGQRVNLSELDAKVIDINGETIPTLNFLNHFSFFSTDNRTGNRFQFSRIVLLNLPTQSGLPISATAPLGNYWIGLESYIYGKHLRDSFEFTQLAAAEVAFIINRGGGALPSVFAQTTVAQPCAILIANNGSSDTVYLELPPPDIECTDGIPVNNLRIPIVPGFSKLRSLGYKHGSIKEWKAYISPTAQNPLAGGSVRSMQVTSN